MNKNTSPAAIRAAANTPWSAPAPVASGDLIARTALQLIAEGLPAHPAAIRERANAPVKGADRPAFRPEWGPSERARSTVAAFAACEWDRPTLQGWLDMAHAHVARDISQGWLVADTSTPDGASREE